MSRKVGIRPEGFRPRKLRRRIEAIIADEDSRKLDLGEVRDAYNHSGEIIDPNSGEAIEELDDVDKEEYSFVSRRRH